MNVFALPSKFKYISYPFEIPSSLPEVTRFNLKLPVSLDFDSQKARVLIVLGHITTEDLQAKYLFKHSEAGTVLSSMLRYGRQYSRRVCDTLKLKMRESFGLAVVDFNFIKFYDLKGRERDIAVSVCADRVRKFIGECNPTHVVFVGSEPQDAVMKETDSWIYRGIIKKGGISKAKFLYTNIIDFNKVLGAKQKDEKDEKDEDDNKAKPSFGDKKLESLHVVGHTARQMAHLCYMNHNPFVCDLKVKPVVINTMTRFKNLMRKLEASKEIAVDTETSSLSRVDPVVLILQFATSSRCGFVIPLEHKNTPFSRSQIVYIKKRVRQYLLRLTTKVTYIGQNFKHDLTVLRLYFDVPLVDVSVWDVMGAEFVLDENTSLLRKLTSHSHLALDALLASYGCDFYYKAKFSKAERASIATVSLTKDVLEYTSMDVQSLIEIKRLQLLRASCEEFGDVSYGPVYERFVLNQLTDIVQIMSHMEQSGVPLDVKYTMTLAAQNGPLRQKLHQAAKSFYDMPSVRRANRILIKRRGGTRKGLFGNVDSKVFDIAKPSHKQLLFIDILALQPVKVSKATNTPSIDKFFQAKHKDVPEVALLGVVSKTQHLITNYVEKLLNFVAKTADGKKTHRIFPSFGYITAVTGRGNSYDPNFQNNPRKGDLAKLIKRIFVSGDGYVIIKMDFSIHEIRCWALIAFDKVLTAVFSIGRNMRKEFYKTGDKDLGVAIKLKGDVHRLNCNFFFGTPLDKVTDEQRDAIKGVGFGTIYGMHDKTLAKVIKKPLAYTVKLKDKFFGRFGKASKWLDTIRKQAKEKHYALAPTGRRRNLFGYFFANHNIQAATDRQAMNSPIQGLGADIGHHAAWQFYRLMCKELRQLKLHMNRRADMPIKINVMVHDAVFLRVKYEYVWLAIHLLHYCATVGSMRNYKRLYGFNMLIPPEIDIEIGQNDKDLYKWDWSPQGLEDCLKKASVDLAGAYGSSSATIFKQLMSGRKDSKLCEYLDRNYPVFVDK